MHLPVTELSCFATHNIKATVYVLLLIDQTDNVSDTDQSTRDEKCFLSVCSAYYVAFTYCKPLLLNGTECFVCLNLEYKVLLGDHFVFGVNDDSCIDAIRNNLGYMSIQAEIDKNRILIGS